MTFGRRNIAAGLFFLAGFMLYGWVGPWWVRQS